MRSAALPALSLLVVLLLGLGASGCDPSTRSTSVSGPVFVGFGYTPADFLGRWSGSLSALGFFETVVIDLDIEGKTTGGQDSRGVEIVSGEFRFRDTATGELEIEVELDDGLVLAALGVLEPGGVRISGSFLADDGLVGDLLLARIPATGALDELPEDITWDIDVLDTDAETTREGKILLGSDGLVLLESEIDGVPVSEGKATVIDEDLGLFNLVVTLDGEEVIFGELLYSHADRRAAGTYTATDPPTAIAPSSEGFLTLDPEE